MLWTLDVLVAFITFGPSNSESGDQMLGKVGLHNYIVSHPGWTNTMLYSHMHMHNLDVLLCMYVKKTPYEWVYCTVIPINFILYELHIMG